LPQRAFHGIEARAKPLAFVSERAFERKAELADRLDEVVPGLWALTEKRRARDKREQQGNRETATQDHAFGL
jgi:hypothetical protein